MNIKFTFKKTILLAISYILLAGFQMINAQTNNVGINTTTPNASAALDVVSTTQGMLVPRMTATQRGRISSPATGLMVYQTDAPAGFYFYSGTAWVSLSTVQQSDIATITSVNDEQNVRLNNLGDGIDNAVNINFNQAARIDNAESEIGMLNTKVLPTGGTANQVLAKVNSTDYNTTWVTPASGNADNLGNHTATQALNMSNQNITNVNNISIGSIVVKRLSLTLSGTSFTSADFPSNINDYTFIKISGPTAAFTIHGLPAGVDGKILYIYNSTSNNLNYPAGSATELVPANRIQSTTSSTNPVSIGLSCNTLIYDSTAAGGNGAWLSIVYQL